jgi:hypothetical protein
VLSSRKLALAEQFIELTRTRDWRCEPPSGLAAVTF